MRPLNGCQTNQVKIYDFNINAEVDRLFDDSSLSKDGQPLAVLIGGGVAAGKTTIRKQKYSNEAGPQTRRDVLSEREGCVICLSR